MKSPIKKALFTSALVAALFATSSSVSALGLTETNRYGRAQNPNFYRSQYDFKVHNMDIEGNPIQEEGTDFSQYYWRGDESGQSTSYDENTHVTTTTYYTIRYWEAK
ncbi:hypothetical protein HMPREF9176_1353 [Streptococcus downei F0415]|uniref:hypothetical protein n=1 Tax=Streptococcus downei TaxID=1317 RepID=UPI0001E99532|nr:hypothetical protein [Streptococcus downei]EFQ56519.1 hypothetical protein HMPREF9176_1353 [Streptococcus downei F0415]